MSTAGISNTLNDLNNEQRIAAEHIDGPFLCIAGPGSGKTYTLVRRVQNLVQHNINPNSILVVTFTKNAATEMKNRYLALPNAVVGPTFCTIHSFSYSILVNELNYNNNQIMSEREQLKFIRDVMDNENKKRTAGDIRRIAKNLISDFSSYHCCANREKWRPRSFEEVEQFLPYYKKYVAYKEKNHMIDFDDMLFKCRDLFTAHPSVLEKYRNYFRYIMVDEFQDTSQVQADILYMLAAPRNNIFITGDDDQSIYEFRSARPDIMLNFPKAFPDCKMVKLTTNYRSEKNIITAASNLIGYNNNRFDKDIKGNKTENGIVTVKNAPSRGDQMAMISQYIKDEHEANKIEYKDIAILCRTNDEVSKAARELSDQNIPFVSNDAIEDIHDTWLFHALLSYLKIVYEEDTENDRKYIINKPSRYIKNELITKTNGNFEALLYELPAKRRSMIRGLINDIRLMRNNIQNDMYKNVGAVLSNIIIIFDIESYITDYCDYAIIDEDRYLDMLNTFVDEAAKYKTFDKYLRAIEKSDMQLKKKKKQSTENGVTISTIHRAKGLEWNEVIIPSCFHGNIPHIPKDDPDPFGPHEEERRLFYVAITRARNKCVLITVEKKGPSEYLDEIQKEKGKNQNGNEQSNDVVVNISDVRKKMQKETKTSKASKRKISQRG